MGLYEDMVQDFLSIREEVPAFFCFEGAEFKAIISADSISEELELGGFAARHTLSAKLLRAELPRSLKVGSMVNVDHLCYRVDSISMRPGAPIVTLNFSQL